MLPGLGTSEAAQRDPRESANHLISPAAVEHVVQIPVAREPGQRGASAFVPRAAQVRSELIDRAVNVTLASLGLVLAAPVMIVFAVLVKLTSPGPIFYSQARVGLNRRRAFRSASAYDRRTRDLGGRPFMILKLRTMQVGAEKNGAQWAVKRDARVTTVGRVMRKYRIDELPIDIEGVPLTFSVRQDVTYLR